MPWSTCKHLFKAMLCLCVYWCMQCVSLGACKMKQNSAVCLCFVIAAAAAAALSDIDDISSMGLGRLLLYLPPSVTLSISGMSALHFTTQVNADSSANSAIRFSARLALQRMSHVSMVQRNHASPRSMSRQSVFLGQPAASRPEGWNTSIKPQSPSRCGDQASGHTGRPTIADSSGTDVAASPMITPRHAAVVCKAIGLSKPRVPSLSLAALQADRHHLSVQTSHRKVFYLTHTCHIALHGIALHGIALYPQPQLYNLLFAHHSI